jgi:transposase
VTARDNRLFLEAMLYRSHTGLPWRDLPERFGDWKNVHLCSDNQDGCGRARIGSSATRSSRKFWLMPQSSQSN